MSQGGQAYQNLDGGDDRASMLGSGVKDPNSAFAGQMGGGQNMMGGGGGYGYWMENLYPPQGCCDISFLTSF